MSNPTIKLARAISDQESLQGAVADLQNRMDAVLLDESANQESIAHLRLELGKLKAALGQARNEEAFWRGKLLAEKDARKQQGDIARA